MSDMLKQHERKEMDFSWICHVNRILCFTCIGVILSYHSAAALLPLPPLFNILAANGKLMHS